MDMHERFGVWCDEAIKRGRWPQHLSPFMCFATEYCGRPPIIPKAPPSVKSPRELAELTDEVIRNMAHTGVQLVVEPHDKRRVRVTRMHDGKSKVLAFTIKHGSDDIKLLIDDLKHMLAP